MAPGGQTRPTSARVREGIASALEAREALCDASVLDLFAGTGALAFEALSRGASRAVLVDVHRGALAGIARTAARLGIQSQVTPLAFDLLSRRRRLAKQLMARVSKLRAPGGGLPMGSAGSGGFDLVFVDPPYALSAHVGALLTELSPCFSRTATLVVEHSDKTALPALAGWSTVSAYRYGDSAMALLKRDELADS